MLRVIDTIRGTIDGTKTAGPSPIRLLGQPILVLNARLRLEATGQTNPSFLTGPKPAPPLPNQPPPPSVQVRIGDVNRPDDGVLGCFIRGVTPAAGRFAPPSPDATEEAILNILNQSVNDPVRKADHPFVSERVTEFHLTPGGDPLDVVILADPGAGLYATSGVLPRKKIVLPPELINPALHNVKPTFRVGPFLSFQSPFGTKPVLPPPDITGYEAEFIPSEPITAGDPNFSPAPISPLLPIAELPPRRVVLDRGWVRLSPPDDD